VLKPTRPLPRVGGRVRILHFGGGFERGTISAIEDGGHRLLIAGEGGSSAEFILNPATARYLGAGSATGERLELLGDE
jgi:hypothetical protein